MDTQFSQLCDYATDFDLTPTLQGDTFFFLRTAPGSDATASFPYTEQGIEDAFAWLEKLEEEEYE
jgi:hypothetical protein